MASRRMFARDLVESDLFIDLSFSAQALYLHLNLEADDDGFVASAKRIMRSIGASENDLVELERSGFLIFFPSGVYAIAHFGINNAIRADRYHPTIFQTEFRTLSKDNGGRYIRCDISSDHPGASTQPTDNQTGACQQPTDNQTGASPSQNDSGEPPKGQTEVAAVEGNKVMAGQATSGEGIPPSLDEVRSFCVQNNLRVNPEKWFHYYESVGWHIGNKRMENWKASIMKWESTEKADSEKHMVAAQNYTQRNYSGAQEEAMQNMIDFQAGGYPV